MTPQPSISSEERARLSYEEGTAKHQIDIRRDDGLYRHLRIQGSGTWCFGHDIVTWPGYLAITGDAGDYVFARTPDMFSFFENGHEGINPHYWAQKLVAPRGTAGVQTYTSDAFEQRIREWATDHTEELDTAEERAELWRRVEAQLLVEEDDDGGWIYDEWAVRRRLQNFDGFGHEPTDCDLWEWDSQFLWCCWAIVRGIARYRQAVEDEQVEISLGGHR